MLSCESRKYFNNAIVMSGTSESTDTFTTQSDILSIAYQLANARGNVAISIDDVINYYRNASAAELLDIENANIDAITKLVPTLESIILFSLLKNTFDLRCYLVMTSFCYLYFDLCVHRCR